MFFFLDEFWEVSAANLKMFLHGCDLGIGQTLKYVNNSLFIRGFQFLDRICCFFCESVSKNTSIIGIYGFCDEAVFFKELKLLGHAGFCPIDAFEKVSRRIYSTFYKPQDSVCFHCEIKWCKNKIPRIFEHNHKTTDVIDKWVFALHKYKKQCTCAVYSGK